MVWLLGMLIPIVLFGGEIHDHGYWIEDAEAYCNFYDSKLGSALLEFFESEGAKSVVDFGCGMGDYVKTFQNGSFTAIGYDGNPLTPELTEGLCEILDLSEHCDLEKQFDWVMSLEVGEHLPQKYERIFLSNLVKHCKKGIVLSWAIKGQGGYGHYNEQDNDYIKGIFESIGFINDTKAEEKLRKSAQYNIFKNTLMVFRRKT